MAEYYTIFQAEVRQAKGKKMPPPLGQIALYKTVMGKPLKIFSVTMHTALIFGIHLVDLH